MRKELEITEQIERYLQGSLSEAERKLFEQELAADPSLREAVNLQRATMQGIERALLKQQIQSAGTRFKTIRRITRWGLPGFGIIVLTVATLYFSQHGFHHGFFAAAGEQRAAADKIIPAQAFTIDAAADTIIETKGGIVLSVPANGFLDENGQPVQGKIQVSVKEALDAASIMKAGLSTKSGNQLLESGGMFFIDAKKNGKTLNIDSSKGIYAELPAHPFKPGMQLYSGKRMANGTIDWVNPVALEQDLMAVDITKLDFYPPHYLDSLRSWGYNAGDKKFTDSLYYSFAMFFTNRPASLMKERVGMDSSSDSKVSDYQDSVVVFEDIHLFRSYYSGILPRCLLNPAKIKTIWSTQFQNTLLSTREFQERLACLHEAVANGDARRDAGIDPLDLYIYNLDKKLSDIDSMVAQLLTGRGRECFLQFAAQHNGRVKKGTRQLDKLRDYYRAKSLAYTQAIIKTQQEYLRKQEELDSMAHHKRWTHENREHERLAQNFEQEFDLNLKEAYRQLGYDTAIRPRVITEDVYTARLTNTGWYNVDKAVLESTIDRTTLNYTDTSTGKKAAINYRPVSFTVNNSRMYDRLYVYLLPDKLNSIMRLQEEDGKYTEQLNELMQYKMICIGWKGEQAFFYSMSNVRSGDYPPVTPERIDNEKLEGQLSRFGNVSQSGDMKEETGYQLFELQEQARQKKQKVMDSMLFKLLRFIMPCSPEDWGENGK